MFTIKLKQTKKIIADEKNICFHSTSNKSPQVPNILNKFHTSVYTPDGFVETRLPF